MAIEQTQWDPTFLEPVADAALEAALARDNGGFLPPGTRVVSRCPWLARMPVAFNWFRGGLACIDVALAEKLALVVSQENSCRYCFAAHRALARFGGLSERTIRRLEQDLLTSELPVAEQQALAFARRLSRSTPVLGEGDLARLRAHGWSVDAIREMALVVAVMTAMNRYSTFLALDPEPQEALPGRWYVRLGRPLLGLLLRVKTRPGAHSPFTDSERDGPFARIVNGFDGLPLGHALRRVIDAAWAFDGVPSRTKALVAVVIARGLGDDGVLADARELALGCGVAAAELDDVLAHLTAPGLTAAERAAVEFARETIWYQPAPLQQRTRALTATFEPPALLDLVGFASLANAIARLGVFGAPR